MEFSILHRSYWRIDGKHVVIKAHSENGSEYFNYKKDQSTILPALVDHDYCFTYGDIGAKDRASDGGVFANCSLFEALEHSLLDIPQMWSWLGMMPSL